MAGKKSCHGGRLLNQGVGKLMRGGTVGPSAGPKNVISEAEAAAYQARADPLLETRLVPSGRSAALSSRSSRLSSALEMWW